MFTNVYLHRKFSIFLRNDRYSKAIEALKREASGRINDLGLCYSKDLQPCDNWESRMAVKRAAALLSDPKLEDEGLESTSMRD